jgi:AraC-like DNA-binding protein
MLSAPLAPTRVWFAHARPRDRAEVAAMGRFFGGCPVAFDRADNGLSFTDEDATRKTLTSDARLLVTAEQLAERALAETPPSGDFVATVAARLRQSGSISLGATAIARKMRLGTRTLQRRLEEAGTTFTELQERVRQQLAKELVRDEDLGLAEVAFRVGFSDAASFSRAFKRWTGRAPGAFRKEDR